MFREHSLIASSPLSDIACFDVLTQKDSYGLVHRGPVVARVGSLVSLAREDVEGWPACKQMIETKSPEVFPGGLTQLGAFQHTVKPSTKFLAGMGLAAVAAASSELRKQQSLVCGAKGVAKETVKADFVEQLVAGTGLWKPDTKRKELQWPTEGSNKTKTLWVVTQVMYAQKIVVGKKATLGLNAQLQAEIPGSGAAGSGTANLQISKDMQGGWVVSAAGSPLPFAFKATRLDYDSTGELANVEGYVKKRLERRGDDGEGGHRMFNPDEDPNFHMRELFYPTQGSQGSSESQDGDDIELECRVDL